MGRPRWRRETKTLDFLRRGARLGKCLIEALERKVKARRVCIKREASNCAFPVVLI